MPWKTNPHAAEHTADAPRSFGVNHTFTAFIALKSNTNHLHDDSDYQIAEGITDEIIEGLRKL